MIRNYLNLLIIIILKIISESYIQFLEGAQSFKALTDKIYLITNGLGDRQVLIFPEL